MERATADFGRKTARAHQGCVGVAAYKAGLAQAQAEQIRASVKDGNSLTQAQQANLQKSRAVDQKAFESEKAWMEEQARMEVEAMKTRQSARDTGRAWQAEQSRLESALRDARSRTARRPCGARIV